jgi:hypothetical protein
MLPLVIWGGAVEVLVTLLGVFGHQTKKPEVVRTITVLRSGLTAAYVSFLMRSLVTRNFEIWSALGTQLVTK